MAAFIAAGTVGDAPLFFTFGSLMPMDSATLAGHLAIFDEALRRTSRRAIVQLPAQWSGPLPSSANILYVRFISHRRVFPQCAMIVHHGGAGTTHTATRAGVPSIVFGLFGSAFFGVFLGLGFSILSGGLTLACMILPIVIRTSEAGLSALPADWRPSAAALGLSRTSALRHLLLRCEISAQLQALAPDLASDLKICSD